MKPFSERNHVKLGVIGVAIVLALVVGALQYHRLPLLNNDRQYQAYFSEAGGLKSGSDVQVSGFKVGEVTRVALDGNKIAVTFKVKRSVHLGDRTEAAVKTKSLLGAKVLEVTPRGEAGLQGPIPLDRTTPAYQLPDALGDLASTINDLDTDELNASLSTLAETFKDTAPDLKEALDGVGRFSRVLGERDEELRNLLKDANTVSAVLAERSDQVVSLIVNTNALLEQLQTQSAALDRISGNVSALAQQVSAFIDENNETLKPSLDKLNGVLTIVDNRKTEIQQTIKLLNSYAMSLGESVASGPFFKAYLYNLLPGQFVQPFIDAAFSDLGLDPNVLLPSELTDPPTGQKATPALPVPYPRTGQAGEPRLTIPDAITGNPGDHVCGSPEAPLPGPGCYPLREDHQPAPEPGGPPPGPPARAEDQGTNPNEASQTPQGDQE
ncbi:virulence factor Mce [Mycolicibacterium phlei]|uniref:MCE family protein n=1 Tax=Mycolicibacterium phlei TaxID=1771 RepID=UPI000777DDE6|nr:MCE family protein [Mycolicibacterium phlei]AMO63851.1 mce related protein [Mycolicibacterium phlei]STZ22305.1 virulence factor Mce [Mycolicibacterium phlei]VEG11941.1 virulence factor Mce [Mycobacteroides chelonae]